MATRNQLDYSLPETTDSGTDPAGRPQPGAGNAGDQDRPRKSPAGPRTADEKFALANANKAVGKRATAEKISTARGRKALRTSHAMSPSSRIGRKRARKKKKDSGGTKRRVR